ncbi:MAG: PKD domain-containing protein, partial [Bacteroidales bacterium]|nr:PKD domain-containing protein [Bacteroidales bacterium]
MIKARLILTVILLSLVQNTFTQDRYRVKNAPFSTNKYDEFSPVIVGDRIIFCSNMEDEIFLTYTGMNNKGLFNIFSINFSDSVTMNSPEVFSRNLITPYNDGPASFDSSGTFMAYSRNIDIKSRTKNIFDLNNNLGIYFASLQDGEWTDIEAFVFNDSTYSNTTPWLTGDGRHLYFASNMPGGMGGSDIYRSEKSETGWGKPENLGANINTKGNEVYPFLTAEGKLFFASDGHPGLGKKDIYMSEEIENAWLPPIHLESPINGKEDDFSLITDTEFTRGYFSSNRSKSDDIYSFNTIVSQLYNCDTIKENNYCFAFWDDKYPGVDSLPVIYEWEFSDGTIIRGLEVEHCFEGAGHYWAKLNIVDNTTSNTFFTQSSMEFDIEDFEQPYISSRDAFLSKEDMEFSGLKSNLPGFTIDEYIWEFGERIFATGPETKYNFKKAGTYYIKMGVKGYNEGSSKSEIKCVIKPIRIVSDNQALAMVMSGIESQNVESTDSINRNTENANQDFSVFDVNPEEEVFRVELLESKDRIMIEDTIFDPLRNEYEIKEFYLSNDSAYSYTVGEYGSLLE